MADKILESKDMAMERIAQTFEQLREEFESRLQHEQNLVENDFVSSILSSIKSDNLFQSNRMVRIIRENGDLLESHQYLSVAAAIRSVELEPGKIQWPRLAQSPASVRVEDEESSNLNDSVSPEVNLTSDWDHKAPLTVDGRHRERPTLSPFMPAKRIFRAKILHLDPFGVVWVIPNDHISFLSQVTSLITSCRTPCLPDQVVVGQLFVCRNSRSLVRGRVLEVKEVSVLYINVDSGQLGQCYREDLYCTTREILSLAPLAIPVKPYGVHKAGKDELDPNQTEKILKSIPRQQVTVWSLQPLDTGIFPLPANIRYDVRVDNDQEGNLALLLVSCGQMKVITTQKEWSKECQEVSLEWLQEPTVPAPPLSSPPHPFPLAVGHWFCVTVQCVYDPLEHNNHHQPIILSPDANKVACHLISLSSDLRFDQEQSEIRSSSRLSENSLSHLNTAFQELRNKLEDDFSRARGVKSLAEGDNVLVDSGLEICRARVIKELGQGEWEIFYTDYGHPSVQPVRNIRAIQRKRIMEPCQMREVFFQMPGSDREMMDIITQLRTNYEDTEREKLLVRIEEIIPPVKIDTSSKELEAIFVTFWKASELPSEGFKGFYKLRQIC